MTCQYGSQKKAGAVDFINVNDIGVLCALFGAQGSLCRLLDIVPDVVKKIASLNPDTGNSDKVFSDILKKVAKVTYKLVIDELTGQIDVSQFCENAPPSLPETITYYDVYEFFGALVPFLNYFFQYNNLLIGNQTKLLDKIVGFWLYQKWFENCECKSRPPDSPPPLPDPPKLFPKCPAGSQRERAGNSFGIIVYTFDGRFSYSNSLVAFETELRVVTLSSGRREVGIPLGGFGFGDGQGFNFNASPVYIIEESDTTNSYNTVNGIRVPKGTGPSYFIPLCTLIPEPPPPPEFCELYPLDILCRGTTRTDGCTDPSAANYNPLANFDDGSCYYRILGCTDPSAANYNPLANFDDGSCTYSCPPDSCRVDCPDAPNGYCCIPHSLTSRLLQVLA